MLVSLTVGKVDAGVAGKIYRQVLEHPSES